MITIPTERVISPSFPQNIKQDGPCDISENYVPLCDECSGQLTHNSDSE